MEVFRYVASVTACSQNIWDYEVFQSLTGSRKSSKLDLYNLTDSEAEFRVAVCPKYDCRKKKKFPEVFFCS